ncbi:MAG: cytochrome c-type biogenesis protein [Pseudolabrys sp.]|jgi:cytochrome c-type biogenesis protein CcmH
MRRFVLIAFLFTLLVPSAALAVRPDEMLKNPAQEARARHLSGELRCMVCQNESIEESNAPLAHDLRVLVRKKITEGYTDKQILNFLVARYGEFVLLRPRFEWHTLLLWGLPPAALFVGMVGIFFAMRKRGSSTTEPTTLTAEEEKRIATLVEPPAG